MLMITRCFFKRGNTLRPSPQVKNLSRIEGSNPSKAQNREWLGRVPIPRCTFVNLEATGNSRPQ